MQIDRNAPLRVTSTTIVGNTLTRSDTIERRLQQLYLAKTVKDVAQSARDGSKALEALNVFNQIDMELLPGSRHGEAALKITVQEKRVMSLRATTFVEQGEGGIEMAMRACNALGSAEALELSALVGGSEIKGTPRRTQLKGDFSQPDIWGLPATLVLSGDSTTSRPLGDSCYEDDSYGVAMKLKTKVGLELEWSARQRDILPNRVVADDHHHTNIHEDGIFSYAAPPEIISAARPSLKSSVSLQYARDFQLPTAQCPRTGSAGLVRLEMAQPKYTGGTVDLFSIIGKLKRTFPLMNDVSLTTSFEGGMVRPMVTDYVHLQDRLFLGGPLFLRAFQPRGAGPKSADGTASLGGRNRWQARIGLEGPPPDWSILPSTTRAHVFVSAGALSDELTFQSLVQTDSRVSIGCGFAFGISLGRLEANVVYAIKADKRDTLSGRLQFGIGAEFL